MAAVLASVSSGSSVFCSPGFDALRFFTWLDEARATWYSAVPTMHQAIVARAKRNADVLGFATRATFRLGDWADGLEGPFDLVLCNPPYVEDAAALDPQVRDHEPASALFAGAEGLDDYRILLPQIRPLLTNTGIAIFEIGAAQQSAVGEIARNQGFSPRFCKDLAKRPRAMIVSQSF